MKLQELANILSKKTKKKKKKKRAGESVLVHMLFFSVVNFWFKILEAEDNKYIKVAYQLMMHDIENKPNCLNWASRVRPDCLQVVYRPEERILSNISGQILLSLG